MALIPHAFLDSVVALGLPSQDGSIRLTQRDSYTVTLLGKLTQTEISFIGFS